MKHSLAILIFFSGISTGVNAQFGFSCAYDVDSIYDAGTDVIQTFDGGYLSVGVTDRKSVV